MVKANLEGNDVMFSSDKMTQAIVEMARPLGIAVHDHNIVGKADHVSLKGL